MMEFERFLEEAQQEAQRRWAAVPAHPTQELLWGYVGGGLSERARWRVGAHLGGCGACTQRVEEMRRRLEELDARIAAHLPGPPLPPEPQKRLGLALLKEQLERLLLPRPLWVHALAYGVGSFLFFGLNALLNYFFPPPSTPIGSPAPPSWWAPHAVGAWGVLIVLHGLLVLWWRQRRKGR